MGTLAEPGGAVALDADGSALVVVGWVAVTCGLPPPTGDGFVDGLLQLPMPTASTTTEAATALPMPSMNPPLGWCGRAARPGRVRRHRPRRAAMRVRMVPSASGA